MMLSRRDRSFKQNYNHTFGDYDHKFSMDGSQESHTLFTHSSWPSGAQGTP